MLTYLESLTIRLAAAIAELPEAVRDRHARFLLSAQQPDGGFAGREGGSDLYYTGFALRAIAVLGLLDGEVAEKSAAFLRTKLNSQESIIDFLSLIYGAKLIESSSGIDVFADASSNWTTAVSDALNSLRRDDGGYAKGPTGRASSTYHTFLVLLCLELIEHPVPDPAAVAAFIRSQAADDGGFREIRVSKRAGTNPTAAGVAVLRMLDAIDEPTKESTIDFLCEMQNDEGGLRANTRIPIADVLSTFTGLLTLEDLGAKDEIDLEHARKYVASMEISEGGFHGAVWDEAKDVEYTFYGLGATALLRQ